MLYFCCDSGGTARHLSEDGLKKLSGVDGQPVTDVRKLVKLALDVSVHFNRRQVVNIYD